MNFVLLGWLRPVRARNADKIVRLRPSGPTARSDKRISDRAAAQFTQRCDRRIGASHLTKRIVAQIEPSTIQLRPRNLILDKPCSETISLERSPVVHAIVTIDLGDELILDV